MTDKENFEKLSNLCSQAREEIQKLSTILFELRLLAMSYEDREPEDQSIAQTFNDVLTDLTNMTNTLKIEEVSVKKLPIPRGLYE